MVLPLPSMRPLEFLAEDEKEERSAGSAAERASTVLGFGLLDMGLSDRTWRFGSSRTAQTRVMRCGCPR